MTSSDLESGTHGIENDDDEVHEMTSIAVISQHPFRSGATPPISTVPVAGGGADPIAATPNLDLDYALCSTDSEKVAWTNFHFVMCIGIVGFFVFWIVLLCRMYLPPEYNLWTLWLQQDAAARTLSNKKT